ncbi:ABC transporter permease [Chlamydiota bacterium]
MRFELTVALKYLIPKWRQLSVSIISLISVLVISLVVWLVVLFLSVTEGIERKWIEELIALNAPVRMTPTEAYYHSYYYEIDSLSLDSNYTTKTIGEKLASLQADPYDPRVDQELSYEFPPPDRYEDGRVKDIVKEGYDAVKALPFSGVRPQEYEVSFGNLRLQMLREGPAKGEVKQTFVTQVSYIASHDGENLRVNQMVIPPSATDYNNLLHTISQTGSLSSSGEEEELFAPVVENDFRANVQKFFDHLTLKEVRTASDGFVLTPALFPQGGKLEGVGLVRHGTIRRVVVPSQAQDVPQLEKRLATLGYQTTPVTLLFEEGQMHMSSQAIYDANYNAGPGIEVVLEENIPFHATLVQDSMQKADTLASLSLMIDGKVQNTLISGQTTFDHLEIAAADPKADQKGNTPAFWVYSCPNGGCRIPSAATGSTPLGEGLLIAKHFKNNGVMLGDRGYLSYYAHSGSSMQEQRIPVYVAGFYDPGMMPVGNKLIFVDKEITALLRGNMAVSDPMLGNGINIWINNIGDAASVKEALVQSLAARGVGQYWNVQSYHDYEFTKPILEQLGSDKNLFTLIAVIILLVACSNIISMLILLVNDKKREIGILQSLGASPRRIAVIFGLCGFVTGLVSCVIGTAAALLTLKNLQSLVDVLSFFQGREAFQAVFYGSKLPNDVSVEALIFVSVATLVISLLAGIIPAVKASRIRPTEILRSE